VLFRCTTGPETPSDDATWKSRSKTLIKTVALSSWNFHARLKVAEPFLNQMILERSMALNSRGRALDISVDLPPVSRDPPETALVLPTRPFLAR
jgi:DNA-directed RNA polymerase